MPADYAHYRFCREVLPRLPRQVCRCVKTYYPLYTAGAQGPDPFFYYDPIFPNPVGKLGSSMHMNSGKAFFRDALRHIGPRPSEDVVAYLFGLLTHYCLDQSCHPLINDWAARGVVGHSEVEADFDRYLLELDGFLPACAHDGSPHFTLNRQQLEAVHTVFPQLTLSQLRCSFRRMGAVARLMTAREGVPRKLLRGVMSLAGSNAAGLVMDSRPNPRCARLLPILTRRYELSAVQFPRMARELYQAMTQGSALSDIFCPIFG